MNIETNIAPANTSVPRVADNLLDLIGQTPLVRLHHYLDKASVNLFAKLEALNPGGSAKDRPARHMIERALADGRLSPGDTVVESSSGNMGIGLAQACALHHLKFICVVDPNAQAQNIDIIRALGGQIELVDQALDGDFLAARLERVSVLLEESADRFWPNQYANLDNPASHETGTVAEIDAALSGQVDYLFVACSSTGTARGCRDFLRAKGRRTKVVAVDAEGSTLFDGTAGPRKISGMGAGRLPELAQGQSFDGLVRVSDLTCVAGCRRAVKHEGILVGGSGGGVLEAVRSMQDELSGKTAVAILHDSGSRYLSTVFDDDWVARELGASGDEVRALAGLQ
ncbi:cysteine synthase CysK [Phaeobacter piscinae]|uniref:N-(2-amino-2-carboxyethyl)-L-glutamate synthase n=1 Tax=Phaeobacter piscinae TaxID=1580596 RepID=A0ABM6P9L3_9RHOB|nr:2,3-diaminopropionate biosynthesis protein SbnA [Phaeobacter piscinae]ATG34317.1 cysteine synthase CysK [Phaeobacter piscinae]AUQ84837.1 cysteine synthase CysK [Phaeobacter piscinae]AUR22720.1 cysteine synthase CysK [Phaeobacter piscinae]